MKLLRPSLVVNMCSPRYLGGRGSRTARTQEAEDAVGHDSITALQPGDAARPCLQKEGQGEEKRRETKSSF